MKFRLTGRQALQLPQTQFAGNSSIQWRNYGFGLRGCDHGHPHIQARGAFAPTDSKKWGKIYEIFVFLGFAPPGNRILGKKQLKISFPPTPESSFCPLLEKILRTTVVVIENINSNLFFFCGGRERSGQEPKQIQHYFFMGCGVGLRPKPPSLFTLHTTAFILRFWLILKRSCKIILVYIE